jgi:hemin uptake protein HemP
LYSFSIRHAARVRDSKPSLLPSVNGNDYYSRMESRAKVLPAGDPRTRPTAAPAGPRRIPSRELFGLGREVRIDHDGVEYRLTRTRQGKLILTK